MNFGTVFKAFDTVIALRDAARRFKPDAAPSVDGTLPRSGGLTGHLEARLTGVVVAALKEAFERDHARLEIERAHVEDERRRLDEERRRAEAALRLEMRRQAADREVGRLRLLAATALVGWIAAVALLVARLGAASIGSRAMLVLGLLGLLGAVGASFSAQARVGSQASIDDAAPIDSGPAGALAQWLVIGGLAVSALSLVF